MSIVQRQWDPKGALPLEWQCPHPVKVDPELGSRAGLAGLCRLCHVAETVRGISLLFRVAVWIGDDGSRVLGADGQPLGQITWWGKPAERSGVRGVRITLDASDEKWTGRAYGPGEVIYIWAPGPARLEPVWDRPVNLTAYRAAGYCIHEAMTTNRDGTWCRDAGGCGLNLGKEWLNAAPVLLSDPGYVGPYEPLIPEQIAGVARPVYSCEHPGRVDPGIYGVHEHRCPNCLSIYQRSLVSSGSRFLGRLSEDGWTILAANDTVLGEVLDWSGPNPANGIVNVQARMFNGMLYTGRASGFGQGMNVWAYRDQANNPITRAEEKAIRKTVRDAEPRG